MDGLGLDNMLSAEQVEKMFSPQTNQEDEKPSESAGEETPETQENDETQEEVICFFMAILEPLVAPAVFFLQKSEQSHRHSLNPCNKHCLSLIP